MDQCDMCAYLMYDEEYIIDINPGDWFVGDVGDKETLESFSTAGGTGR